MSKSLPARPSLEQLKNQAKDLLKFQRSGDPEAIRRIQAHHTHPGQTPSSGVKDAEFSLSDAQLVIAREYGLASWPKLKAEVESILLERDDPLELFKRAFEEDDAPLVRKLLERHPHLKPRINEPVASFDSPALIQVRSREMLDVLLEAGADINVKSRWWAGGFGLLHGVEPKLAAYAIERGASIDAHAAARLGLITKLRELLSAKPEVVHERGGDGQTPLHFASAVEIAELLLERGADIDARDLDHESTPAQWMIRERQEIARFLVRRGCQTDILMAAALGDVELVRRHLDADPACIHMRVTHEFFPKRNHHSGGTIYQWTLGWYVSPHDVAKQFGHPEVYRLLMERSPLEVKFMAACWNAEDSAVKALLDKNPGLVGGLSAANRQHPALAARNNNLGAVRTLLAAGLPVDSLGQHGATPLHWAAFHGNLEMVQVLLSHRPPLEQKDHDFQGTPLGWAIHGSENGWHSRTGDYPGTVAELLKAGAKAPDQIKGAQAVRAVLLSFNKSAGR
jgi:ankyrin repeat protein